MHFLFQLYSPNFPHSYNFDTSTSLSVPYNCVFYSVCHVLFQQMYWLHNVVSPLISYKIYHEHFLIPYMPQFPYLSSYMIFESHTIPYIFYTVSLYWGLLIYLCLLQEELDIFLHYLMFSVYSNLGCFPVWLLEKYQLPLYSFHSFFVFKLSLIFLHS